MTIWMAKVESRTSWLWQEPHPEFPDRLESEWDRVRREIESVNLKPGSIFLMSETFPGHLEWRSVR